MTQKTSRFSKLKVGIAAVALSALLVVPAGATDRSEDVSIEIAPGAFELALTEVEALNNGEAITYDPVDQQVNGALNLDVTDYSGSGEAWDITMVASSFQPDGWDQNDPEIDASNLEIASFGGFNLTHGATTGLTTGGAEQGLNEARTIVSASSDYAGGQFDVDINLELNVPGGTPPDTYESTITVDSANAPN
jgi:hypothetical protein